MNRMTIFPQSRMKSFAALVASKFGVQVRLRGKEICVRYSKPPVIFLPDMDGAKGADLLPIYGFALHEAAHLRYTDQKVSAGAPDYLTRLLHNAVEDCLIETLLERDFPGAREMLTRSYVDGIKALFGEVSCVEEASWLGDDARERVAAEMTRFGLDGSDAALVENVAKRLEIIRAAKLWILEARRYPLPLYDWPTHPWHSVFQEETTPRARNTQQAYDQAVKIIQRLGIKPCLPGDQRPIHDATAKKEDAKVREREAADARKALKSAQRERNAEWRKRCAETPERQKLVKAREELAASELENERQTKARETIRERLKRAEMSSARQADRLAKLRSRLAEIERRIASANEEQKASLEAQKSELESKIRDLEQALEASRNQLEVLREQEGEATLDLCKNEIVVDIDEQTVRDAREADAREMARIKAEVFAERAPAIQPLENDAAAKSGVAKNAVDAARTADEEIKARDAEVGGEPVANGAAAKVVAAIWERFQEQGAADELSEILSGEDCGDVVEQDGKPASSAADIKGLIKAALHAPARKYTVLDRSLDAIEKVTETPEARAKLEQARSEYAGLIREMREKLKRLHSPVQKRLKVNSEQGRLNSRIAFKIGIARAGIAVDLSRVWQETTTRTDPKFAVTLLIDCSGSMNSGGSEAPISVARKSASALSEVLRELSIPHEILGHTTLSNGVNELVKSGEVSAGDFDDYSRVVPFRGLVFKTFGENAVPAALFADVSMQDNLDGEALIWASQRLTARPEKTKLLISISDGMPQTHRANTAELERHLLMTCKAIEARESEGFFLHGIGIGEKRVEQFYKNADVLNSVADLPRTVMGIVEKVMKTLAPGAARI